MVQSISAWCGHILAVRQVALLVDELCGFGMTPPLRSIGPSMRLLDIAMQREFTSSIACSACRNRYACLYHDSLHTGVQQCVVAAVPAFRLRHHHDEMLMSMFQVASDMYEEEQAADDTTRQCTSDAGEHFDIEDKSVLSEGDHKGELAADGFCLSM